MPNPCLSRHIGVRAVTVRVVKGIGVNDSVPHILECVAVREKDVEISVKVIIEEGNPTALRLEDVVFFRAAGGEFEMNPGLSRDIRKDWK
ncbi:MAG TPA: hypothetical protein VE398_00950 [Acidobacteriota bacterium]|nr:hypothetical protein [Acidobacteriota bacterium]